ncbi:general transcription factor IIH subunit 3 isoform X1 [Prionailurus iriomotensis]
MVSDEDELNLLVIIVDTNPIWWGKQGLKESQFTLSKCIDAVMVLGNSHLFMNRSNKLAVIASHIQERYDCVSHIVGEVTLVYWPVSYEVATNRFLYPGKNGRLGDFFGDPGNPPSEFSPSGSKDGKYELFTAANEVIAEEIKDLMTKRHKGSTYGNSAGGIPRQSSLLYPWRFSRSEGVLGMKHTFLVIILRTSGVHISERLEYSKVNNQEMKSRILVIKAAEDSALQYMNFMNVIFAAQKQNILIDACVLDSDSGLLQQACDITGGLYLKVPQMPSLLQYLLWVFLPDQDQRSQLILPPPIHVDYRAACFCHRNLIEIGYVCSVCLSIFCNFSPICTTCETAFKISLPPVLKAKKKKLKASA